MIKFMPNLTTLDLYSNKIDSISDVEDGTPLSFPKITELNVNDNPIQDWSHVLKLATMMPNLKRLACNSCSIPEIYLPSDNPVFKQLMALQLNFNKISTWQSIFCLNQIQTLTELKFRENPVTDNEAATTARQIVIASLANLKIFNGTEIEKVERFGAEVDFLKKYGVQYLDALKDPDKAKLNQFYQDHPRYLELVERFGAPEEHELRVQDTSLKANLLKVHISCPDCPEAKPLTKSLPPAMVISKLKNLLTRMIKPAKGQEIKLTYASADKKEVEVPLDNDMRDLFFYDIKSGDSIFVRW